MKRAVVLLGAGASADVSNGASTETLQWKPPLAAELFSQRAHTDFREQLYGYRGAQTLSALLIRDAEAGTLDLEERLRSFANHQSEVVQRHFKDVPPYLRDVLWACSRNYVRIPGCYIELVHELLQGTPHEVVFIVLNYDDLLEQALQQADPSYRFENLSDYGHEARAGKVFKLHGSIDWVAPIGSVDRSWEDRVDLLDPALPPGLIQIDRTEDAIKNVIVDGQRLYPVLTAPLAGKKPGAMVCPTAHVQGAEAALAACDKLLVVGWSGRDGDVLDLLSRSELKPRVAHYVGLADVQAVEGTCRGAVAGLKIPRQSDRLFVYNGGLRNYLSRPEFRQFVTG